MSMWADRSRGATTLQCPINNNACMLSYKSCIAHDQRLAGVSEAAGAVMDEPFTW